VFDNDTFADMKKNGYKRPLKGFVAIHMPKNTWRRFHHLGMSLVMGFGIIWHMWLLVAVSFVGDDRRQPSSTPSTTSATTTSLRKK
jgi:cytochrome o ubiquinol oxidase subunit 1